MHLLNIYYVYFRKCNCSRKKCGVRPPSSCPGNNSMVRSSSSWSSGHSRSNSEACPNKLVLNRGPQSISNKIRTHQWRNRWWACEEVEMVRPIRPEWPRGDWTWKKKYSASVLEVSKVENTINDDPKPNCAHPTWTSNFLEMMAAQMRGIVVKDGDMGWKGR